MSTEAERKLSDIAVVELTARLDGLERIFSVQISQLAATINELRIVIEKLETKGDTSCGKCKAEIDGETKDLWAENKKLRDRVEILERKDGEVAKKGVLWAGRIAGGILIAGVLGLIWTALKGA